MVLRAISRGIYPPLCLHCGASMDSDAQLCSTCFDEMPLLEPRERCCGCFQTWDSEGREWCDFCHRQPLPMTALAAALSYQGPARSMVSRCKFRGEIYLAKGMAALVAIQWDRLGWPFPDHVVFVPMPWPRRIWRGYNQSEALAEELGKILGRPSHALLRRRTCAQTQRVRSGEARRRLLSEREFFFRRRVEVEGKILLLVDDVITTGATLSACAEVLWGGNPRAIYGLGFALTEREESSLFVRDVGRNLGFKSIVD